MNTECARGGARRDEARLSAARRRAEAALAPYGLEGDGTVDPASSELYDFAPDAPEVVQLCLYCGSYFNVGEPSSSCALCGCPAGLVDMLDRGMFREVVDVPAALAEMDAAEAAEKAEGGSRVR